MHTKQLVASTALGLAIVGATATTAAAEQPPMRLPGPVVHIEPSAAVEESILGGPCYRGFIDTVQPAGFVVSIEQALDDPLEVTVLRGGTVSDMVRVPDPTTVTIEAGDTSAFVPRIELHDVTATGASWWADVEASPTAYGWDGEGAGFAGLAGARADAADAPCYLTDRVEQVDLVVGEVHATYADNWQQLELSHVGGTLPPGMSVDDVQSLAGTPSRVGRWSVDVLECPLPAQGDRICATVTYEVTVHGRDGMLSRTDPTIPDGEDADGGVPPIVGHRGGPVDGSGPGVPESSSSVPEMDTSGFDPTQLAGGSSDGTSAPVLLGSTSVLVAGALAALHLRRRLF